MKKEFFLNSAEVDYYAANPFKGCFHPLNAAYGRAAEAQIISITAEFLNADIKPFNSHLLPHDYRSALGRDYLHDGLIFGETDGQFYGVIEAKLALRDEISLNREVETLQFCKDNGLMYILTFAEIISKEDLFCEFQGFLDLTQHMDLVVNTKVSLRNARPYFV